MEKCKIEMHTSDTIKVTAPEHYKIVRKDDGYDFGKVIYEAFGARLNDKYQLILDEFYLNSKINQ